MPLPSYTDIAKHPSFAALPYEEKVKKTQSYWDRFDAENPQDSEFSKAQRDQSLSYLDTKQRVENAAPVERRFLEPELENQKLNLAVTEAVRTGKVTPEQAQGMVEQRKQQLGPIKDSLQNLDKFRKGELEQDLAPVMAELKESALQGGVFGSATLDARASDILPGGQTDQVQKGQQRYAQARDGLAKTLGITPEETDDIVRHRMGLQKDLVSRDVLGQFHIKDELLVKGNDEVQKAVAESTLPDKLKSDLSIEAPQRLSRFKAGVVENLKQQHPELAADIKFTGKVDEDYAAITDKLNKDWSEQLGGGAAAYGAKRVEQFGVGAEIASGSIPGVGPIRPAMTGEEMRNTQGSAERATKRQESINQLSNFINKEKTNIFGVDAATVGGGVASGIESVGLGALTGGLGTALVSADRIAKAGKAGKILLGGLQRGLNTAPIATIYGTEQGLETYERAIKAGKSPEEALKLSLVSFAVEGGITATFGAVKLGGTEDIGQKLANPALRREAGKSVAQAWRGFGTEVVKSVGGEQLEELSISLMNDLYVESKLNPGMTVDDMKANLKATAVSTLFSSGPLGAVGATAEQGTNLFKPTHEQTDSELHDASDDIYKNAAQENLPEAPTATGTLKAGSTASLADIERTRSEQIALTEDPEEKQALEEATPEELAGEWGVKIQDEKQTPPPVTPEAPPTDSGPPTEPDPPLPGETPAADTPVGASAVSETETGPTDEEINEVANTFDRRYDRARRELEMMKEAGATSEQIRAKEKEMRGILDERIDALGTGNTLTTLSSVRQQLAAGTDTWDSKKGLVRKAAPNKETNNDNQQPTESSQLEVPVPAVPGNELAANPAGEGVVAPAQSEVAPNKPIQAVHYSREPMSLEKGKDIGSIEGRYEEESILGEGFYAMEPRDEDMWKNASRFSLGENRNAVTITPKAPTVITPQNAETISVAQVKADIASGKTDAVVIQDFPENFAEGINERVDELWTPKFPEGKTSGKFTNVTEYEAALTQAIKEKTGLSKEKFEELQDAGFFMNQIFVPKESAPDVVTSTASIKESPAPTVEPTAENALAEIAKLVAVVPEGIAPATAQPTPKLVQGTLFQKGDSPRVSDTNYEYPIAGAITKKVNSRKQPEKDAEYLAAVEAGDIKTAQRMVDAAAKAAGTKIEPQWHWTQAKENFVSFDPEIVKEGFHFGTKEAARSRSQAFSDRSDPQYRVYLIGDVLPIKDLEVNTASSVIQQLEASGRTFDKESGVSLYSKVSVAEDKQRLLLSNKKNKPDVRPIPNGFGIFVQGQQVGFYSTQEKAEKAASGNIISNIPSSVKVEIEYNIDRIENKIGRPLNSPGEELSRGFLSSIVFKYTNLHEDKSSVSYLVFDPNQIKSADPVTRDASGNVIPLSQRFNLDSSSILYQNEERNKGYYQPGVRGAAQATIGFFGSADASTGVHEYWHDLAENDFFGILTPEEVKIIRDWETDGTGNRDTTAKEKGARGWERFLFEGTSTGFAEVDAVLSKLSEWLRSIYQGIQGSSLNVDISPEVRAIMEKLVTRAARGEKVVVTPTKVVREAPKPATAPAPAKPKPKKKIPKLRSMPSSTSIKNAETDKILAAAGLPEIMAPARKANEESWDEAMRVVGSDPRAGSRVVSGIINSGRSVNNEVEEGVLLHETAIRKADVVRARALLAKNPGDPGLIAELKEAQAALYEVVVADKLAGTAWGRIGQFRQRSIKEDFTLEAMEARFRADVNEGAPLSGADSKYVAELQKRITEAEAAARKAEAELGEAAKREEALIKKLAEKRATVRAPSREGFVDRVKEKADAARTVLARFQRLMQRGEKQTDINWDAKGMGSTSNQVDIDYFGHVRPMLHKTFRSIVKQGNWDTNTIPVAESKMKKGEAIAPPFIEAEWDDKQKVLIAYGHEGRSRSDAANKVAPGQDIPVHIFIRGIRARNLTDEMRNAPIVPESGGKPVNTTTQKKTLYRGGDNKPGLNYYTDDKNYAEKSYGGNIQQTEIDESKIIDLTSEGTAAFNSGYFIRLMREKDLDVKSIMTDEERGGVWKQIWNMDHTKLKTLLDEGGFEGIKWVEYGPPQGEVGAQQKANAYLLSGRDPESGRSNTLYQSPEDQLTPDELEAFAAVGAEYLANGARTLDEFTAKLTEEFPGAEAFAEQIFDEAQRSFKSTASSSRAKTPTELKNLLDKENPQISNKLIYNMARGFINQGLEGRDVLDAVTKLLNEDFPDLTREEVVEAFTGYGKVKYPSKEEDLVKLRELRNIERIQRQIDDVRQGLTPKKTGQQRDAATLKIRELKKELQEAMRAMGIKHAVNKNQLRGALDAIKSRYKNEIEELEESIRTKTKRKERRSTLEYDDEIKALKAKRDKLKADYDNTFGVSRKAITEQQRVKAAVKSLTKRIAEEEAMLKAGILERVKAGSRTTLTPEIIALRTKLDGLRAAREKAREALHPKRTPEERALARALSAAQKSIDRYNAVLSGTPVAGKAPSTLTPSAALNALWSQRNALRKAVEQLRKASRPRLSADEKARRQAVAQLDKSIKEIERRIATGDFSIKPKSAGRAAGFPDVVALKAQRDSLRAAFDALKKASQPQLTPEEKKDNALVRAANSRRTKIEARIAAGDYVKVERVTRVDSAKVAAARLAESKAKEEWNRGFFEAELKKRTLGKKSYDTAVEVLNFSRTMKTIADVSAVLRQGLVTMITHPFLSLRAVPDMFRAGFSEVQMQRIKDQIEAHPRYALSQQAKLFLADTGPDTTVAKIEEAFRGRWAKQIPGLKGVVNFSERTYNAYLNSVRIAHFNSLVEAVGGNPSVKEAKILADFVNKATGRGDLRSMESAAAGLAAVFFSPKFVVSRFQLIWGAVPVVYDVATGFHLRNADVRKARKAIAVEYARFVVGAAAIYGLVALAKAGYGDDDDEIETDPRSSNFGKIKLGNTYIDPMGGLLQAAVFSTRMILGETKTQKGEVQDLHMASFGKQSYLGVLGSFLRSKLSPVPSAYLNVRQGADVIGSPATVESEFIGSVIPLAFGDVYETMRENGVAKGTPLAVLGLLGLGVQSRSEELSLEQYLATLAGSDPVQYSRKPRPGSAGATKMKLPKLKL